jgi:hypothetical protein
MRSFKRNKKGQFVIIAVLLIAIMIVSIGALLHGAVTYYKHEPWEEYSTLIRDVELNSRQLLELSLVNYTQTGNQNVLNESLSRWQKDLLRIYPGVGINLEFTLANGLTTVDVRNLNFEQGLVRDWNQTVSSSAAKANFSLNISSMGIAGYAFTAEILLKLNIVGYEPSTSRVTLIVTSENGVQVSNLNQGNFKVNDATVGNVTSSYDQVLAALKYGVGYQGPTPPLVEVWDQRGIHIIGYRP